MIILMSDHPKNHEIANIIKGNSSKELISFYPKIDFSSCKDERLILVEFSPKKSIQNEDGRVIAEVLNELGLPDTVKTIDIYSSDMDSSIWLPNLAGDITNYLYDYYQKDVAIRIVSNINYSITMLVPPTSITGDWQVFGYRRKGFKDKTEINSNTISTISNKSLLWKGRNLDDYFKHSSQTFISMMSPEYRIPATKTW